MFMLKLLKYLKPYWLIMIIVVITIFIQVQADLALPDYMARIVNEGIIQEDQDLVWSIGKEMLLVSLIGGVFTIISGYLISKASAGLARDVRAKLFSHVESFSLVEINKFSIASLITRSTNDIQQVQGVLGNFLRPMLFAPIMGVGAVMRAINTAPSISWIIGLTVLTIISIMAATFSITMPRFKKLQQLVDKLNLVARENLTGLRVIRAFNTETYEESRFNDVNVDLTKANLFVNRVMVILFPVMMFLFNITSIAIIWFGAHLVADNELQIGDMMAFMQYSMQVIFSFLMISMMFIMVPRAAVSIDRINEVLDTDLTIKDPKSPKKIKGDPKGKVEFKNVSFAYENAEEPVIRDISFVADPGKTTAIIGSTGSGKSTIINLIPRFFDVTKGKILIDGIDIRDLDQKYLHDLIGYTPQKPILFSGSIASNIKYGDPNGDDKRMEQIAEIAQAEEFITDLPEKYDTNMAQGGLNFSGGQKQRVSIARALYEDPKIFIFDDTFSSLDFKTDAMLRKALKEKTKEKTVLVVSQRIGTILDADKIIVLSDNGTIAGIGTHQELMKGCEVYQEIAQSQLSEDELRVIKEEDGK